MKVKPSPVGRFVEADPIPDRADDPDRTRKLLCALAGLGACHDLIPMLAAFGGLKLSADDRRFIEGPLVVHGHAWIDQVPKWMGPQAKTERIEIVLGQRKGIVGPTELAAVIMPATYEAPLQHDTVEMYLWAAAHAMGRHDNKPPVEFWNKVHEHGEPMPDDDWYLERSGRCWQTYWPLADEIRRKVIAHARPLEALPDFKKEKAPAVAIPPTPRIVRGTEDAKGAPAIAAGQYRLF
jgi:hypothetical protein